MPCPSCCPSFMAPTYLQCRRVSVTISKLDTRKRWLNSGVERALVPIHEQHGSLPPGHPVAPHAIVPGGNNMLSKHKTGCKNRPAVLQVAIRQHASALARALPVFPLPYIMIVAANQLSFAAAVHAQNVTKIQRRKGTECYKNREEEGRDAHATVEVSFVLVPRGTHQMTLTVPGPKRYNFAENMANVTTSQIV
jgi:hypothetical protein